jgi:D-alanyl-lipoteichoic acid acyltransferase DltB (MBOAT superfamily)
VLFNSIEFALFLPLVFGLYWLIGARRIRWQNALLLVSSYVFYGWWDYRFLSLIAFSSAVDFLVGQQLYRCEVKKQRRLWLALSVIANIGLLGYFKYYNFFVQNFVEAFRFFGRTLEVSSLEIILPVGISFYTFQTLSYTLDIYRRKLTPTRDPLSFFTFVSFFPQLVAGPIERASNLLPQFFRKRSFSFEDGRDGMRQILWGLFKKVVVADTCAIYANEIFGNHQEFGSLALLVGALCFTFQIYGDFSGYSDIAIGTARLFGFRLMTNFRYPYFSRDMAEFWRRWHISLSTWFRDYVYIPLGGSQGTRRRTLINVIIIFVVSGFWHGANWTFIVWGGLNGLYFLPLLLAAKNRQNIDPIERFWPGWRNFFNITATFFLAVLAWIFFRAEHLGHAFAYLGGLISFRPGELYGEDYLPLAGGMLFWEWIMRKKSHGLDFGNQPKIRRPVRWVLYLLLTWMILYFFGEEQAFIYFQF